MRPSVWHVSVHPHLIGKGHPTVRVCGSGMPTTVKVTESNKAKIFEIVRVPSGSDSSRQRQQIAGSNFIIGSDRTNSGSRQQAATSIHRCFWFSRVWVSITPAATTALSGRTSTGHGGSYLLVPTSSERFQRWQTATYRGWQTVANGEW
jgi:hypothetical protein